MFKMPAAIKFTNEQLETIVDKYLHGKSTVKLGEEFDCDPKVIARILRKQNVNIIPKPFKFNLEDAAKLIECYEYGFSYSELEQLFGVERECIHRTFERFGYKARPAVLPRQHYINDEFFKVIDTEEKAYWLGFITTDGCITTGNGKDINTIKIHIGNIDFDHLLKLSKAFGSNYVPQVNESNGDSVYLNVVSYPMITDLARYGVVPRKTGKCYFPEGLIPKELERHYWRGCIDGDGCLSFWRGNEALYLCGDTSLVKSFQKYCIENIDVYTNVTKDLRVKTDFSTCNFWVDSLLTMDYFYKDCCVYLNRKMIRYNDLKAGIFLPYEGNDSHYRTYIDYQI